MKGLPIDAAIKQALLRTVLTDGSTLLLVTLHDGRCAVLRGQETLGVFGGDLDAIDDAVQRFQDLARGHAPGAHLN